MPEFIHTHQLLHFGHASIKSVPCSFFRNDLNFTPRALEILYLLFQNLTPVSAYIVRKILLFLISEKPDILLHNPVNPLLLNRF